MRPIEEIREAVRVLRERASAATPGPWRTVIDDSESQSTVVRRCCNPIHPAEDPDHVWQYDDCPDDLVVDAYREATAMYIALMDPPVALALADWLDAHARDVSAANGRIGACESPANTLTALTIARAVLGRAEVRS